MRLNGKVIVVTGGASGIGAACCERFVREGARVAVVDSNGGAAGSLAHSLGSSAVAISADVADETAVASAMDRCAGHFGSITGLVNSAGVALRQSVTEQSDVEWTRVLDVNLRGAFLCSKYAIPRMTSGGSIVHISSVVGLTGVRSRAAYSASKGGLIGLMRNMAMDYASAGIRVNCVCPGFVRTPFTAGIFADPQRKARLTGRHALGRLGEPEDIANAVLFLLSDDASWITGQSIAVDGGFSAGSTTEV